MIHNLVTQNKCKEFVSRLQTNDQWIDGKLTTGILIREVILNFMVMKLLTKYMVIAWRSF